MRQIEQVEVPTPEIESDEIETAGVDDADAVARRTQQLAQAFDNVRVARPAALQVLRLTNDPNSDAASIGRAVEADPVLTAQVMRLANSAAFGMAGRVGNAPLAVSLVGFSAVRSIATFLATGLQDHKAPTPPGFWGHAAAVAAGASIIGPRFSVARTDAFAAGILHDLGLALLHAADPQAHLELIRRTNGDDLALCDLEREGFGISHPDAAAQLLTDWQFPEGTILAVVGPPQRPVRPPLSQVVMAADTLAHMMVEPETRRGVYSDALAAMGFDDATLEPTIETIKDATVEILSAFQPGATLAA